MRLTRTTLLTALLIVAALAVGSLVTQRLPQRDEVADAPFLRSTVVGQAVTLRTTILTVTQVRGSRKATDTVSKTTHQALGVWLVATVEFTPTSKPLYLPRPELVTPDGRTFGGDQAISYACGQGQTRLTLRCDLPLEVTEDALVGARLRIGATSNSYRNADDQADVDLGITADAAAAMLANTQPIPIRQPAPAGTP